MGLFKYGFTYFEDIKKLLVFCPYLNCIPPPKTEYRTFFISINQQKTMINKNEDGRQKRLLSIMKRIDRFIGKYGMTKPQANKLHKAAQIYILNGKVSEIKDEYCASLLPDVIAICDKTIVWYDKCVEIGRKGAKYGKLGGAPKGNQNARKNKLDEQNVKKQNIEKVVV